MVFMGSERFPVENAYDAFLAESGGSSNAYTEAELTCFHFDVQPAALRGALERFSSQFVAPLCLESATDREARAPPARLRAPHGTRADFLPTSPPPCLSAGVRRRERVRAGAPVGPGPAPPGAVRHRGGGAPVQKVLVGEQEESCRGRRESR